MKDAHLSPEPAAATERAAPGSNAAPTAVAPVPAPRESPASVEVFEAAATGDTREPPRPLSIPPTSTPTAALTSPLGNKGEESARRAEPLRSPPQTPTGGGRSCPNPLVYDRINPTTGEIIGRAARPCKRKSCGPCRDALRRRHVAHFLREFLDRSPLLFLTLTLDPSSGVTAAESRAFIVERFSRRFLARLRRRLRRGGEELAYLAVIERHASGAAHLHGILACSLPLETVREQWFASGGGAVMDVSPLPDDRSELARAVGYLLKQAFEPGPTGRPSRLLTSEGLGYDSARARAARRAYVEAERGHDGEVFALAADAPRPAPRGSRPAADAHIGVQPHAPLTTPDGRRATYVDTAHGGRFGVRRTFDPATGALTVDVVEVRYGQGGRSYVPFASEISEAEAVAIVRRLARDESGRETGGSPHSERKRAG